jgi:integration host factor subunit alpha
MTVTKAHMIESVQENLGYPKNQSAEIVEALIEIIKRTLASGDDLLISGFGKFCVKKKKERKGRNPATNAEMILRERKVVVFKCSGLLRDKVNGK